MAEIDDGHDPAPAQIGEGLVAEVPVVAAVTAPGSRQRRAVAQEADAEFLDAVEVASPVLVMAAAFHLVDTLRAVSDSGVAVLDSSREHETGRHVVLLSQLGSQDGQDALRPPAEPPP